MSVSDIENLRAEVNPVFTTAQACLRVNAEMGDADALRLMTVLGFDSDQNRTAGMTPEMVTFVTQKLTPGFNVMVETRFAASNRFLLESGVSQVVDLPCGYTPRGVKFSRHAIRYFGMDLPAVIDAMAPAVTEVIGESEHVSYHAVDATNYTSLRTALGDAPKEELLISIEGLLMYLTQSELEEVFDNVRRLLHEFGGRWITTDNELIKGQERLLSLLVDGDEDEIKAIEKMAADNMPKVALAQNSFFRPDEVERFINERGFDLEKLPLYDYLPDELRSLEQLPPDKRQAARDVFKDVYFWVMTPKPVAVREDVREEKDFKAQMRMRGGDLEITVSGRLDTITAPTLLAMFRDAEKEQTIASVTIDMANLVYISSAGLRVLILMLKALEDADHLNLINMSKAVAEIIETTGLDTLMC